MQTLSLDGDWKFRVMPAGSSVTPELLSSGEWLPATVPGGVHTDLMAASRIPDPFHRLNNNEAAWVAEKDWLFVRTFEADSALLQHDRVQLVCEGLDTFATVVLNGREIARTRNAFILHTFDVKSILREGSNTLAVGFASSDRVCRELEKQHGVLPGGPRVYARKPQYATGWDWGPVLPNCGIWRSISLRAFSSGRIANVCAPAELREDGDGTVSLVVNLERTTDEPLTVDATLCYETRDVAAAEIHNVGARAETILRVQRPLLWWPAGCGDQDMYDLSVRIRRGAEELDRCDLRIAFRTLELVREPDPPGGGQEGESFIFKVNGRRIFCKGANWIPADSFPWRVTPEKYRKLLELALDGNMNMLRVWGGGYYEPDVFFDLCDEIGLLVWQDFMFACGDYPDLDWFQKDVAEEAEAFVTRVRNHPCLALYCGNNENQWGHEACGWPKKLGAARIYDDILPSVCGRLDPGRPWWPGSPFGGPTANSETHGDCHNWSVWHGSIDYRDYRKNRARFISEFGFQGFPTMETVRDFAEPGDLSMDSEVMNFHQRCPNGSEKLLGAMKLFMPEPENFERTVLFSQIVQAEALQTAIEHWRRLKWHTSGTLIWQFNDCWPVISWSTVDYHLRSKPAHYYVRRAYAPVLVTAHVEGDEVIVTGINDTERAISGTLDVELFDIRGEAELLHTDAALIPEDAAEVLCTIPIGRIPHLDKRRHFVWVTFYSSIYDSSATCFFAPNREIELVKPDIMVEAETDRFDGEVKLSLTAPVFVKGVWLSLPGQDVRFSDNAFDLIPYVSHEVTVTVGEGVSRDGIKDALRIQHCNRSLG